MDFLRTFLGRLLGLQRRWLGAIVGAVVWLVWMVFGFWATILLVLLIAIGYWVGRVLETRQTWKDIVDKLFSEHFSD